MNRGQAVLGISLLVAGSAVVYAHYAQVRDKQQMHEGVERDKERLRVQRERFVEVSPANQSSAHEQPVAKR